MRKETIHQVDYRVKYVLDSMSGPHFKVVWSDVVANSYWRSFARLMNANYTEFRSSKKAPLPLIAAADTWISRVVQLSPVNSPELYEDND